MSYYTMSPSKHMTLDQLLNVKADNYVAKNGNDYCPFEVEARIIEIMNKQAASAKYQPKEWSEIFNAPFVPQVKKSIEFKLNTKKPMFVVNMANEKAA